TNDLVAGHIEVGIGTLPAFRPFLQGDRVRILGTASRERFEGTPNIPTVAETVPGFEVIPWLALFGPGDMSQQSIDRLAQPVMKVMQTERMRATLLDLGMPLSLQGPEEFAQTVQQDYEKYGKVIRDHNISLS